MSMDEVLEEFAFRLRKSDDFEVKVAAQSLLDALKEKRRKDMAESKKGDRA